MLTLIILTSIVAAVFGGLAWYHFRVSSFMQIAVEHEVYGAFTQVFDTICNLPSWRHWNAWVQHEPTVVIEQSENTHNIGARIVWYARMLGEGSLHTQKINPYSQIVQQCAFKSPYKLTCQLHWSVRSIDDFKTQVSLQTQIKLPWLLKWQISRWHQHIQRNVIYSLDLLNQYMAKNDSSVLPNKYDIRFVRNARSQPCSYVYELFEGAMEDLVRTLPKRIGTIFTEIATKKGKIVHYPFCLYTHYSVETHQVRCHIGIPVEKGFTLARYQVGNLRELPVMQTKLSCALRSMAYCTPVAWQQALQHAHMFGAKRHKRLVGIEVYTTDLSKSNAEDTIQTILQVPYK